MSVLSVSEKIELACIPVATGLAAWLTPRSGVTFAAGENIGGGALLILSQGFIRDLWLLRQARSRTAAASPREARCMCVESALGLTGVVAGIGLAGFGRATPVAVGAIGLAGAVVTTLLTGFLLKDFVFEWSPWKIYREKDHTQVIFRWRR